MLILEILPGRIDKLTYNNQINQSTPLFIHQALPFSKNKILQLRKLEQGIEILKRVDSTADIAILPSDDKQGVIAH